MRTFYVEYTNFIGWEKRHYVIKVRAHTIKGAIHKARKKYQTKVFYTKYILE